MKALRKLMDTLGRPFAEGGRLERLQPLWEATDSFLFTTGKATASAPHVRDGVDLKRVMITVVVALFPCMLMAMFNTGYQAALAVESGYSMVDSWQTTLFRMLPLELATGNILACFVYGALFFLPVYIVTLAAGGFWEVLFAVVRRHEINEGFLVTSALFPLLLPPLAPLWQVALGISFGVVIGKEVFGGVGMNILNPALTSRAFLFFAYPGTFSFTEMWVSVDSYSGATSLVEMADGGREALAANVGWWDAFIGLIPGSMGETSTIACLIGAAIIIITGVGSWRIMLGVTLGTIGTALLLNGIGSETNPAFDVPFWWHFVMGGWAFGMAFMATDPVTSPYTEYGRYAYGFLIGVLIVLIRVVNPAFPGGVMLAILFMNVFASLLDHFVMKAHVARRKKRMAAYAA